MSRSFRTGALAVLALMVAFFAGSATVAVAQGRAWVQIEAQPTLREAEARARAYAGAFDDVQGYQLSSGWYAIALGPYAPDDAALRLALLLRERMVPGDSFLADGRNFRQQFWPLAAMAPEPVAPAPATPPPAAPEPGPAAEAPAAPGPALQPAALPDETPAEARRSEAALTRGEREELQVALRWFGHYTQAIDGAFGPGTRGAMQAWQTDRGFEPTGVLTTAQRAALLDSWRSAVDAIGLERVSEVEAGIDIDLPLGLVAFDRYEPPFVHFSEIDGSGARVLLISQPGDQAALFGLYDLMQTLAIVPADGPRERRARSFEISGSSPTLESYTQVELAGGLIKGFTLVWRPADAATMVPVLAAMKSSFRATGNRALDPGMVPIDEDQKRGMLSGLEIRGPERSGTGFYVDSRGTVLTSAETVAACGRVLIDGGQEMDVALRDESLGIAVLRPRATLAPPGHARFAANLPRLKAEVAVAGYSFGEALSLPTMTFGSFEDQRGLSGEDNVARLTLSALPGDAGGPVMDASGAVVGVLLPRVVSDGRVLPADVSFIAPVPALTERLSAAGLRPETVDSVGAMAPEDLTTVGSAMAVLVSCWN